MAHYAARRVALRVAWIAFGWFWGTWSAVIPAVKRAAELDDRSLGLVLLAVPACAVPAMIMSGRAYDRYGGRILVASLALLGAIAPLLGGAGSWLLLGVCLAAVGAASGVVDVSLNAATVTTELESGGNFVHGAQALFPVAGVAASLIVAAGREAGVPIWCLLGTATLIAAVAAVLLHRAEVGASSRPSQVDVPLGRARGVLVLLGIAAAAALLVENAVQQWSSNRLEYELGAAPGLSSLAPGVFALCLFTGRLLVQRGGFFASTTPALYLAAVGAGSGLLLSAWAPSPALAMLGFAITGLGLAAATPAIYASVGHVVDEQRRGRAIARISTIGYSGYFLGPVVVGLASSAGGLSLGLTVVAGIAAFLVVPALWLPRLQPSATALGPRSKR